MAPGKQLEGTRITRKGDPDPKVTKPFLAPGRERPSRPTTTPTQSCSANFYRYIKRRVRRSFRGIHCKENLIPSKKQVAHKLFSTEGGLPGPKRPLLKQDLPYYNRQQHSGGLYKQGKRHEVGLTFRSSVKNPYLTAKYSQPGFLGFFIAICLPSSAPTAWGHSICF